MQERGEFFYRLMTPIIKPLIYRWYRVDEIENVLPKDGPYLLIGEHQSALDPIVTSLMANRLIHFIYGDVNANFLVRHFFLWLFEMIPFTKNTADFRSVRLAVKEIKKNHPVGLYPEGEATWDGSSMPIIPSTSKLIKLINTDVYVVHIMGSYLSKPRWAKFGRRGRIELNSYKLFDKDVLKSMSLDEIQAKLEEAISYKEEEWQEKNKIRFQGPKQSVGIERLFYYCPECGSFNCFKSIRHRFWCESCGRQFIYTEYGRIDYMQEDAYENAFPYKYQLSVWNRLQQDKLKAIVKDSKDIDPDPINLIWGRQLFPLRQVSIYINDRHSWGRVYLSKEGLVIKQFIDIGTSLSISYAKIKHLSMTLNSHVVFWEEDRKVTLVFTDTANASIRLFYDWVSLMKEGTYGKRLDPDA